MPAWFLLPAAVSAIGAIGKYKGAAARTKAIEGLKPSKDSFKANTGYLKKYISDLRGRSSSRARTELAMRPALRAIGQQQGQAQRQLSYSSAQQGLAGSGIEAQKRLSLQQSGMQQAARVGETVGYSELNKARALQGQREGQVMKGTMQIGQMEGAAEQRFQDATRQWEGQVAGAEAAQTGAMWEGISDVAGSAVSGIGGHYQKIGQQKQFLDFLTSNPDMTPEMMAQYQGLEDGGIVDYFKESSGVQGAFDAETKKRKKEYESNLFQANIDYDVAKSEYDAEIKGKQDRVAKIDDEINKIYIPPNMPANRKEKRYKRKLNKRLKSLKLEKESISKDYLLPHTRGEMPENLREMRRSTEEMPESHTQLSQTEETDILKKHLLEGMNAGVFTKEGLISGYTKHRAKKEMSSFMSKVDTMDTASFWSDPYAMNNPQAAVKIWDDVQKKKAETATAKLKAGQDQALGQGTLNMNNATNILDDPATDLNETHEALVTTLNNLNTLGLSSKDLNKLSNQLQSRINKQDLDSSSNKELAGKWGDAKSDVSVTMMAGVDGEVGTGIMNILNKEGNIEGMTTADYQEIEGIVRKRIAAIASAEGATDVISGKGLNEDMAILFELLKPESKESKEVKILQGVLKKVNNSEFRREDAEPGGVMTKDEYDKLPSGTQYTAPDGSIKIKQ
tara:strand:- start:427 stop:2460 length:2034 start_codon:yes stop_codon:yes gene_type:complete